MLTSESGAEVLELVSDELCLNFANTVGNHKSAEPNEHIGTYSALVGWSRQVGILTGQTAERLLQEEARRPDEARRAMVRAITLREAIYRIFSAVSEGSKSRPADLSVLNRTLSTAMSHSRLVQSANGFAWDWEAEEDALDQMLWPIARSAADLLTSEDLSRARECANETCGWLFVDTSKNHSRRWCSMSDCGNRAKARRHYARLKKTR